MVECSSESLPTGWVRDENGALRRETVHSMLRRLPGWDYRGRAIYQITITLADRPSAALGRLEVRGSSGWVSVEAARAAHEPCRPEAIEDMDARLSLLDQLRDIWRVLAGGGLVMSDVLQNECPKQRDMRQKPFIDY